MAFSARLSRFVDVPSAICQQSCAQAKVTGDEHVQQQATVDAGFIGSRELVEDDICVLFFHLLLGSFPAIADVHFEAYIPNEDAQLPGVAEQAG